MLTIFRPTSRTCRPHQWPLILVVVLVGALGGVMAGCGDDTHEIEVFGDVRYMNDREWQKAAPLLDVYAPKHEGPWPVVVMLHGGGVYKDNPMYTGWATKVAERGAVVFVPNWARFDESDAYSVTLDERRARLVAGVGDIATAVCFARATAANYGGDPEDLTLFGHSFGAMGAAMEALSGAPASEGGLDGAGSTIPESLVLFDGDHLLLQPGMDEMMKQDPGLMQVFTPWQYLDKKVGYSTTFLASADRNLSRSLGDPWADDSWLALRDPSGDIRRGLEGLGALEGPLSLNESQIELLAERLRAAGNTVTYTKLSHSTHTVLGTEDMEVMLDALVPSK